jgi:2-keto-3-deoxy-L-rhamnonate aldolase RhmA
MRDNLTKRKLLAGNRVFGTFTLIHDPSLAELIGAVGYDFIGIDMEHAAVSGRSIENMIRAAQSSNLTPIIRIPEVDQKTILWVLDCGAEGLILPFIENPNQATEAVRYTRYPPDGVRTVCSATRVAGRGAYRQNFSKFVEKVNKEMLVVGLIETTKGVDNFTKIVETGIDVFIVGRADLSMEMGLGYAPTHPEVVEATRRVLKIAMDHGKTAGIVAYQPKEALEWMEFGCNFIWYSQPEFILSAHYADALAVMRRA